MLLSEKIVWQKLNNQIGEMVRQKSGETGLLDELRVVIMRGQNEAQVLARFRKGTELWVTFTESELQRHGLIRANVRVVRPRRLDAAPKPLLLSSGAVPH